MNEAKLQFASNSSNPVYIYGISEHCYKCDLQLLGNVSILKGLSIEADTRWPFQLVFQEPIQSFKNVSMTAHFIEGGEYQYHVNTTPNNAFKLSNTLVNDPTNQYMPLMILLAVLAGMQILWLLIKCITRKTRDCRGDETNYFMEMEEFEQKIDSLSSQSNGVDSNGKPRNTKSKRLKSLDIFRGITICLMIFVNYGGGYYYFIDHSVWNGLTVSDLVFPWFIFIMGISINLSYKSFLKSTMTIKQACWGIFIRSLKLFGLGLILNQGFNLPTWRVPGVLQRFGVCYFVIATLNILSSPSQKTLLKFDSYPWVSPFKDILPYCFQWLFISCFVIAHTMITFKLNVPGCPSGYLGPGGIAEHGEYFNCTGGATGYIDRLFLGDKHIYGNPTCKEIYLTTKHFDPEGILGILPSIVLTFLGLQAGRIIILYPRHRSRISRWLIWTLLTGGIGYALTLGTLDDGIIPINKNLWSLSYILVTAATGYALLLICYALSDIRKLWDGAPFYFCGMNAIALYLGHMLISLRIYWHEDPQTHASSLVRSAVGTALWVIWAYFLYKKKLFFTV